MLSFKQFIIEMPVRYAHLSSDMVNRIRKFPKEEPLKRGRWGNKVPIKDPEVRKHGYELVHYNNESDLYEDQYELVHKPTKTIHFRVMGKRNSDGSFQENLTQKNQRVKPPIHMGHVYSALLSHNKKIHLDTGISPGMEKTLKKNVVNHPGLKVVGHYEGKPVARINHHNFDDFVTDSNSEEEGNDARTGYAMSFRISREKKK